MLAKVYRSARVVVSVPLHGEKYSRDWFMKKVTFFIGAQPGVYPLDGYPRPHSGSFNPEVQADLGQILV